MSDDALIDELVADIIDSANKHVRVAAESIERLTSYDALAERYGDFRLGIDWTSAGARQARADIHRALRDKGMNQRQIAAVTGVSDETVARDLGRRATSVAPDDEEAATSVAPAPSDQGKTWDEVVDRSQTPESMRRAAVLDFRAAAQRVGEVFYAIDPPPTDAECKDAADALRAVLRQMEKPRRLEVMR